MMKMHGCKRGLSDLGEFSVIKIPTLTGPQKTCTHEVCCQDSEIAGSGGRSTDRLFTSSCHLSLVVVTSHCRRRR
jgi:hypothetical protein